MIRAMRYLIAPTAAVVLILPLSASPAAAHDTSVSLGSWGSGGVRDLHRRVVVCDHQNDGRSIETTYRMRSSTGSVSTHARVAFDGAGYHCDTSGQVGGRVVEFRVCVWLSSTCTTWRAA